ncbi:MAG: hypothetical protein IT384_08935 [Deltaproteobacteria bacterium]|nr:hypothetical protein [Deltaproteobacteria bacterium]
MTARGVQPGASGSNGLLVFRRDALKRSELSSSTSDPWGASERYEAGYTVLSADDRGTARRLTPEREEPLARSSVQVYGPRGRLEPTTRGPTGRAAMEALLDKLDALAKRSGYVSEVDGYRHYVVPGLPDTDADTLSRFARSASLDDWLAFLLAHGHETSAPPEKQFHTIVRIFCRLGALGGLPIQDGWSFHNLGVHDWQQVASYFPPTMDGARLLLRLANVFGGTPGAIDFYGAPLTEFDERSVRATYPTRPVYSKDPQLSPDPPLTLPGPVELGRAYRQHHRTTMGSTQHYHPRVETSDDLAMIFCSRSEYAGPLAEGLPSDVKAGIEHCIARGVRPEDAVRLYALAKELGVVPQYDSTYTHHHQEYPLSVADWAELAALFPFGLTSAKLLLRLAEAFEQPASSIPYFSRPLSAWRAEDFGARAADQPGAR